ncbi:Uma2 family endonuclease [Streptomyces sp. NBC_00299]|uniref:Uma2 family endonuclease n=1 Tax=Streptomyces sp. NBC_00299 TaxID=2975705 RepID=UPI002E2AA5C7|nr:Uma2 family endonuclease [Streptomyces sp. NBC_00299]
MGAVAQDPITQKLLLDWFVDLDTPEGLRAELVEGEVVVTPVPDGHHEHCISRIVGQMYRRSQTDMLFSGNKGLKLRNAEGYPQDHVIPDGTFAPKELRLYRGADPWMPCAGVAMVLEVTSSKPQTDRETKRRCYARGGIPLYLLVDRESSWITLFSDPESGDYQELRAVVFGKPLPLPHPFAFDLDTADFL